MKIVMKLLKQKAQNDVLDCEKVNGFISKKTGSKKEKHKKKDPNDLTSQLSFERIEDGIVYLKKKGKPLLMGVLAVSGMDIANLNNYERESAFENFARATLSIRANHKYVFTYKTPCLTNQKSFIKYKSKSGINRYAQSMLDEQYKLFDDFEQNHYDRTAYVFIYDEDKQTIQNDAQRFMNQMSDVICSWCSDEEIQSTISKLICLDTADKTAEKKGSLNDILLPKEIEFAQNYYKINDKYAQSVVIYDYPATLDDLQFMRIVSGYNETVVWDVSKKDSTKVLKDIQASLKELESRGSIGQDTSERIDTQTEFEKLQQVYINIQNGNEQIYFITFRILVNDDNLENLQKRTADIVEQLGLMGLSAFIPTNTTLTEFLSVVTEENIIQNPFPVYDTLSRQFPFSYQSHLDNTGFFWGYTATGGITLMNTFIRNSVRNSYDLLAIGIKGGGKSVTLKALLEEQLLMGNKVLALDIEGEYRAMAMVYDGQVIKMNNKSRINPIQITKAVNSKAEEDVLKEDEARANFASELSRIRTFMTMYIPNIDMFTLEVFMDLVTECLSEKGIFPDTDVSFIKPEGFPTFSNIMEKLKIKLNTNTFHTQKLAEAYSNLEVYLRQLTGDGAYASMFDGATNVDVQNNSLVVFDVKSLSEMADNIYNAQLFNILTIMWSMVCRNLEANHNLINPWDKKNVVCLIDEAHRFISVKYPQVTEFIEKLVSRTRKYNAALWFATQSILDFMPNGDNAAADKIKVIFALVQYKIILKQSPESIETLQSVFPQFTTQELKSSPSFIPGQMLLSLGAGRNKLELRRIVSPKQLLYCGNDDDRIEIIHNCFSHYYNECSNQEYGLMLKKMDVQYFRRMFTVEAYSYLGLKQNDSQYLDNVVINLIDNLIRELLSYAEEVQR